MTYLFIQLHLPLCGHCCWRAKVQQSLHSLAQHCQWKGDLSSILRKPLDNRWMVYAGVPLLVVLVLWSHHPHRRSPRLPPHLHNYPTSEVQTVVIVVVVVIVIVVVIVVVVVVPESLSHLSASPPNQTVHTTEFIKWLSGRCFCLGGHALSATLTLPPAVRSFTLLSYLSYPDPTTDHDSLILLIGAWPLLPWWLVRALPALQEFKLLLLQISPQIPWKELQCQGDCLTIDTHDWMDITLLPIVNISLDEGYLVFKIIAEQEFDSKQLVQF